jgi:hypothetical protein
MSSRFLINPLGEHRGFPGVPDIPKASGIWGLWFHIVPLLFILSVSIPGC